MIFKEPKKPKHKQRPIHSFKKFTVFSPKHLILEFFENFRTKYLSYELSSKEDTDRLIYLLQYIM